jgi:hypothetical protein
VAVKQARVAVHGYGVVDPAALIERRVPLMVFARSRQMLANSLEVLSWLREQGANCLVVSENECNAIGNDADLLRSECCAGRQRDARICGAAGVYRDRPADRPFSCSPEASGYGSTSRTLESHSNTLKAF